MSSRPPSHLPVLVLDGSQVTDFDFFVVEANRSVFGGYVASVGQPWSGNLDAFNDILRGGVGTPDGGFVFLIHDARRVREALGWGATVAWLEEALRRGHSANRGSVAANLERARRCEGKTLFDLVIEIICAHGPGGKEAGDRVFLELDDRLGARHVSPGREHQRGPHERASEAGG